jgi:diphthamide synthase (EF-2-diphthine--ammonia ligase)
VSAIEESVLSVESVGEAAPIALAWSGGKDSALALRTLRETLRIGVCALLATVKEGYERVSMHGVRRELLARQAAAAGLPLVEVTIPPQCGTEVYEERMERALAAPPLDAIGEIAFGDLFLEDVRAYREARLEAAGKRGRFPLWGRNTDALAREFVAAGFEAIVVCLDPSRLDRSFAGRPYDLELLRDLPRGVDPCGEKRRVPHLRPCRAGFR